VATRSVPITTTLVLDSTLALLTVPTVMMWAAVPQLGMELLPDQQQAYQEEQRAQFHPRLVDTELWATQCHDELTGEKAALDA
jgi:hypothetical protein